MSPPRPLGPAPGPVLFARYAYPPNALGYCGPDDSNALFGATTSGDRVAIAHLARQFEGAFPYLQLIAACNHIGDPLERDVVEAYWLGNDLLKKVPPSTLVASLDERFAPQARRQFESIASPAALFGGVAHHSFHVFAVYPWLGMARAGMQGPPLRVLDRCRIRWGTVEAVDGENVLVRSRRLVMAASLLQLGDEQQEVVRRSLPGTDVVDDLVVGDLVSMHWDWICDRLSTDACRRLSRVTARNLRAVNALDRPGPAVVTDRFGGENEGS